MLTQARSANHATGMQLMAKVLTLEHGSLRRQEGCSTCRRGQRRLRELVLHRGGPSAERQCPSREWPPWEPPGAHPGLWPATATALAVQHCPSPAPKEYFFLTRLSLRVHYNITLLTVSISGAARRLCPQESLINVTLPSV